MGFIPLIIGVLVLSAVLLAHGSPKPAETPLPAAVGSYVLSDAWQLASDAGCMLAFVYNQENHNRLVVVDEANQRHLEVKLDESRIAPFWEGGNVYVVAHSGTVEEFAVAGDRLVRRQVVTVSTNIIRDADYSLSSHRLYLICTCLNPQRKFYYELSALDFPARKTLWTRRIDDPGSLKVTGSCLCVTGLSLVQLFNSDTGERLAVVKAGYNAHNASQR